MKSKYNPFPSILSSIFFLMSFRQEYPESNQDIPAGLLQLEY